jgi:hypothetical protein
MMRQLLYTAVSRAQQLLVVVGTEGAIQKCLKTTAPAAAEGRFRAKLRAARVKAGLPRIQRAVYGPDGWEA